VSLALLEYFILFFVLEKAIRHAEDCVVTKDIESGGRFCWAWFLEPVAEVPAKQKEIIPSKAFETSD
jgi:hypothetical protein